MKNYARKTNRAVTRYRTPSTFRNRHLTVLRKHRAQSPPPHTPHVP